MLCEKCQQREAIVHLTKIFGDRMTRENLCEPCSRDVGLPMSAGVQAGWTSYPPQPSTVWELADLSQLLGRQPRFPKEAYDFVREALNSAVQAQMTDKRRQQKGPPAHVSATLLLEAFRKLASRRFGKQARAHLAGFGILRTEDVGEIVFDLIEARLLAKTPEDKQEDFANGYDFESAFPDN